MRLRYGFASALCLAVVAAASAEDVNKAMDAQRKAFEKAIVTKDISWFKKVAAKDFYEVGTTGVKISREQSLQRIQTLFAAPGGVNVVKGKVLKVTTKGKQVIALVEARLVAEMTMGDSKPTELASNMRYEQTWSKDGGKWMLHILRLIDNNSAVAGKPAKGS